MREGREAQTLAGVRQSFARLAHGKERFIVCLARAEAFHERTQLRIDRDHKALRCLVPVERDPTRLQINVRYCPLRKKLRKSETRSP